MDRISILIETCFERIQHSQIIISITPSLGAVHANLYLKFLADMGEGNEESFLRQTLEDIKKTEIMMKDIVHLWKTGDVRGLERVVITDIQLNYPQMYQLLLVERNRRWLPQIKTMLETEPVELVLVGAAHLIGPDGILVSLEQQGYLVEQQ